MKTPKSILIVGRRWFRRGPGGTYCTATIYVDGVCVHKTIMAYGPGDMYVQYGTDWLEENGYMPGREHHNNGSKEPGWRYFRDDRKIPFSTEAIDVKRERDL